MAKRLLCLVLIALTLAGCQPGASASTPTALPALSAPPMSIQSEAPSLWEVVEARSADLYPLVEDESGGLRLDPEWQIERAEHVYRWVGAGDPLLDRHIIELEGDQYIWDGQREIPASQLSELALALRGLYPTPGFLESPGETESYPSWDIELRGSDGTTILLNSSSTSNGAGSPWNVLVNGRFYAQYSGQLADPSSSLFHTGLESLSGLAPATPMDIVGRPRQFTYGFTGLLPIAPGFAYHADLEGAAIQGSIEGRSIIGIGGMIRGGVVTHFDSISLETTNGRIACSIDLIAGGSAREHRWEFTCPVSDIQGGDPFSYDIRIGMATNAGTSLLTEGTLSGEWGVSRDQLLISAPEPLHSLLAAHPGAASIFKDHALVDSSYRAFLPDGQPYPTDLRGTVHLLGQASIEGQSLRYTVTLPFAIDDGELVYWAASRGEIKRLLYDILAIPEIRERLREKPDTVLNLWYSIYDAALINDWGTVTIPGDIRSRIGCDVPGIDLPAPELPLRAFAFDRSASFFRPQYLFDNEGRMISCEGE